MGKCLASAGVQIISGLALGIDGAGQQGCAKWRRNNLWRVRLRSGHLLSRENIGLYMDVQREGG